MAAEAVGADVAKRVILVVEDTGPIADLVCQALNDEPGYEAMAVGDAAAALEALGGVRARLVILDVTLPGLSGEELYDRLQEDEATRGLPAVFVSADPAAIDRLRARGMPYVLAKPFDLEALLAAVREALAGGE